MWIFLNDAMLSIVEHRDDAGTLLVRARIRGDIQRVFPDAAVAENQMADYRFRANVAREAVAAALASAVHAIDYPNFKASVRETTRHDAYLNVWSAMAHAGDLAALGSETDPDADFDASD